MTTDNAAPAAEVQVPNLVTPDTVNGLAEEIRDGGLEEDARGRDILARRILAAAALIGNTATEDAPHWVTAGSATLTTDGRLKLGKFVGLPVDETGAVMAASAEIRGSHWAAGLLNELGLAAIQTDEGGSVASNEQLASSAEVHGEAPRAPAAYQTEAYSYTEPNSGSTQIEVVTHYCNDASSSTQQVVDLTRQIGGTGPERELLILTEDARRTGSEPVPEGRGVYYVRGDVIHSMEALCNRDFIDGLRARSVDAADAVFMSGSSESVTEIVFDQPLILNGVELGLPIDLLCVTVTGIPSADINPLVWDGIPVRGGVSPFEWAREVVDYLEADADDVPTTEVVAVLTLERPAEDEPIVDVGPGGTPEAAEADAAVVEQTPEELAEWSPADLIALFTGRMPRPVRAIAHGVGFIMRWGQRTGGRLLQASWDRWAERHPEFVIGRRLMPIGYVYGRLRTRRKPQIVNSTRDNGLAERLLAQDAITTRLGALDNANLTRRRFSPRRWREFSNLGWQMLDATLAMRGKNGEPYTNQRLTEMLKVLGVHRVIRLSSEDRDNSEDPDDNATYYINPRLRMLHYPYIFREHGDDHAELGAYVGMFLALRFLRMRAEHQAWRRANPLPPPDQSTLAKPAPVPPLRPASTSAAPSSGTPGAPRGSTAGGRSGRDTIVGIPVEPGVAPPAEPEQLAARARELVHSVKDDPVIAGNVRMIRRSLSGPDADKAGDLIFYTERVVDRLVEIIVDPAEQETVLAAFGLAALSELVTAVRLGQTDLSAARQAVGARITPKNLVVALLRAFPSSERN
ncbi:MAG TPA: hypothetical protein VMB52_01560 [Verrucomicrobiae bacterium]|nr:hypothetical protein [Verrucomicrobiae bacterium]